MNVAVLKTLSLISQSRNNSCANAHTSLVLISSNQFVVWLTYQ